MPQPTPPARHFEKMLLALPLPPLLPLSVDAGITITFFDENHESSVCVMMMMMLMIKSSRGGGGGWSRRQSEVGIDKSI